MEIENKPIVIVTFYKFVTLSDYGELRQPLRDLCNREGLKGTILLAEEGINATVAGSRGGIDALLHFLKSMPCFADLTHKESFAESPPFQRMKVRLKREIVTLGAPQADPKRQVGIYVRPEDWNALIGAPDVLLLDTRNQYEITAGTFHGAINPETTAFRQFPEYVKRHLNPERHTKIAMFCTGGIRCEKASSYLLSQGFDKVYHLEGGILKYLETVPPEESKWEGECFVFDQRVALDHDLQAGVHALCYACGHLLTPDELGDAHYREGISCRYCIETLSEKKRAAAAERQRQIELAGTRKSFR